VTVAALIISAVALAASVAASIYTGVMAKNDTARRLKEREPEIGFGWQLVPYQSRPDYVTLYVHLSDGEDLDDATVALGEGGEYVGPISGFGENGSHSYHIGPMRLGVITALQVKVGHAFDVSCTPMIFMGRTGESTWRFVSVVWYDDFLVDVPPHLRHVQMT
jgi:hypothetical protein